MNGHDDMDEVADWAVCRHGGPCTLDHECRQGRCLEQKNGGRQIDTKGYTGPDRRIPLDSKALRGVVAALLAFWILLICALPVAVHWGG